MSEIKTVRVQWHVDADVTCPTCDHVMNFMEVDEWWFFSQVAENKESFEYPLEFKCPKCKEEFNVNGSDY